MKLKRCYKCKRHKSKNLFNRNSARHDKLQVICKSCQRTSNKIYYKKNYSRVRKISGLAKAKRRIRNQEHVLDYKLNNPCVDCATQDIRILEFDHVRGVKRFDVSIMVKEGMPLKKLKSEIGKCVVRCSNCHRLRTSKKNNDYASKHVKKHKLKYNKEGMLIK